MRTTEAYASRRPFSTIHTPSRRGFLGIFAAASAATAVGGVALKEKIQPSDWRTKPVEQWTKADFIAEAKYRVQECERKKLEVFRVGMDHDEEARFRGFAAMEKWWRRELDTLYA